MVEEALKRTFEYFWTICVMDVVYHRWYTRVIYICYFRYFFCI